MDELLGTLSGKASETRDTVAEKRNEPLPSSTDLSEVMAIEATFFREVRRAANRLFDDSHDLLFLPAGRTIAAYFGVDRLLRRISEVRANDNLDGLLQSFIQRLDSVRRRFKEPSTAVAGAEEDSAGGAQDNRLQFAQEIMRDVLRGEYRFVQGNERIVFGPDLKDIPLNYASSGQQEIVWILQWVYLLIADRRSVFVVIEEPEAHLFPTAQKQIIDLVSLLANADGNQIVITTHSPYILSSFNNLLYAYQLGQQQPEKVETVVPPMLWLDPTRLGAYMVDRGGIESIVDPGNHLIYSSAIDSASEIILDTFNKLFDLDE
jgi:hypothetical protein